jgi:hypothetical protein
MLQAHISTLFALFTLNRLKHRAEPATYGPAGLITSYAHVVSSYMPSSRLRAQINGTGFRKGKLIVECLSVIMHSQVALRWILAGM